MTHSEEPCAFVARQLTAYLDGALDATTVSQIEAHAATCPACEARLDAATFRPVSYTPTPPPALRDATLRAVATRRRALQWRRGAVIGMMAAAAVLMITIVARQNPVAEPMAVVADSGHANGRSDGGASGLTTPAMREAEAMANAQAASEFSALEAAMRELEAALTETPDDAELRRFRSTIRARRDELERRVRDATS